ncbi:MAG: UbiD family decarboxylase [Pirellulaceae bacterium]|jgi:4-hydroxy-3-polyprenylbenzoate decarboxylase|nr:UbiD family decarboxylase [Pirellulaceae bacterium]MDP7018563.1 UbiD family decarboxylase [Pirellulaceae bacterium]
MGYRSLQACVADLEQHGRLVRLTEEVDPHLEAAEIQRRVYANGGPAVLFERVSGTAFPMVSNLFGTLERARFIFRDTLETVRRLIELKIDPKAFWRRPSRYWNAPLGALRMIPKRPFSAAVMAHQTEISRLPQLKCWPDDGGAFITLPQVYSEHPERPGLAHSNLGMYRIQLSGGEYQSDREVGLHYQIHRGIGVHHQAALRKGGLFRVNVFVGGTPAMALAAVMPLPEGLSELGFAGALAGRRIGMFSGGGLPVYADADFCIQGTVEPDRQLPEGPFGDHLGYYSLAHHFPVLHVERVTHRANAIWPFTVVGRPPQEDTTFGELIHEITGPIIPTVVPGVEAVHAVDAAGVHPLMLAIGSERYTPYNDSGRPQELLTQANAILGQGQMSLAKYLFIINRYDVPDLHVEDVANVFAEVLRRVDWSRDLHFQTQTTVDTLDYTGGALNSGSKLTVAAAGPAIRDLPTDAPADSPLGETGRLAVAPIPGVIAIGGRPVVDVGGPDPDLWRLLDSRLDHPATRFPLWVLVDDAGFATSSLNNFLWTVFTRSDPARDVHGVGEFIEAKHWGCRGPLIIDARSKPHHAPPLIEDPATTAKVDARAARGGPLAEYL